MKHFAFLILVVIFCSCKKQEAIKQPDFNVTGYTVKSIIDTAGNAVKAVTFTFSGDAGVISLYPGLIGNDYQYKDGRILGVKSVLSSFATNITNGTQDNQLSVLVSNNFNGTYDITNIHAATWVDITNRFSLNVRGATSSLNSGTVDIKDLITNGKPFYYAYKYVCKAQAQYGLNSTWRINDFTLQATTDIGATTLATLTTAGWGLVNDGAIVDAGRGAAIESTGAVRFNGNNKNQQIETESWAVTKGFLVDKVDLGPDRAIAIKSVINPRLETFSFNYTQSGTYNVVFVASNADYNGQASVTREIKVIVP